MALLRLIRESLIELHALLAGAALALFLDAAGVDHPGTILWGTRNSCTAALLATRRAAWRGPLRRDG
jgi:hypothetical protein